MSIDYLSAINSKGSGLNVTQIVDSLVNAETTPDREAIQKKIDSKANKVVMDVINVLDNVSLIEIFVNS